VQVDRLDWEYRNELLTWIKDPAKPRTGRRAVRVPTLEELHAPEPVGELQAAGYQLTQVLRQENGRVWLRWGHPLPTPR
jgi:hypothetical protein